MTIFFMHIPKTAGSSVSRLFIEYFGQTEAIEHCQRGKYRETDLNTLKFVSGHIGWPQARRRLDSDCYRFTLIRDPVEQLISHLNWVKRMLRPEFRKNYEQNTKDIQAVVRSLANVNISDAESVDYYLLRCKGKARQLFLNAQARYFLPPEVDCSNSSLEAARQAVRWFGEFNTVGPLERADEVVAKVAADNGIRNLGSLPRENIGQRKEELVGGANARALLEQHMQIDMLLYNLAQRQFYRDTGTC